MLFNNKTLKWDKKLCDYFDIPMCMLPEVKFSSDDYGVCEIFGQDVPICGVAGDQQSSLFGQACFDKGDIKNTYGTGCFLLMNIGKEFIHSKNLLHRDVKLPEFDGLSNKVENSKTNFKLASETEKCKLFNGKVVNHVVIKESPDFIKERLLTCGINSINNVVDISNYVMLETGQPLHYYSLDKLEKHEITDKSR